MIVPSKTPWMKQLADATRFGINAREVRALVKIAVDARQSQVVEVVRAAVNSRNNVFDVENRQRRIILVKLAILTAIAGALANRGSRRGSHRL
jgi:hypothetical protein